MPPPPEWTAPLGELIGAGGWVLWPIFGASLLLWTLLTERYLYLHTAHPQLLQRALASWRARAETRSWYAHKVREGLVSELTLDLSRSLSLIQALVAVCPLLGLLGTVTGMVQIFDAMALPGTNHAQALAGGVSRATVPTLAGMVVALSGLFFGAHLRRRVALERRRAADLLRDTQS
jgi:biopolymer transport protein ExbB